MNALEEDKCTIVVIKSINILCLKKKQIEPTFDEIVLNSHYQSLQNIRGVESSLLLQCINSFPFTQRRSSHWFVLNNASLLGFSVYLFLQRPHFHCNNTISRPSFDIMFGWEKKWHLISISVEILKWNTFCEHKKTNLGSIIHLFRPVCTLS